MACFAFNLSISFSIEGFKSLDLVISIGAPYFLAKGAAESASGKSSPVAITT